MWAASAGRVQENFRRRLLHVDDGVQIVADGKHNLDSANILS